MNVNEALIIKEQLRMEAINESDKKRAELHARIPRVRQIDKLIESIPMRLIGGQNPEELKKETESLRIERARLLSACGYEEDFDEPKFSCKACNDSGYTNDLKICACVKNMLSESRYVESSLANGLRNKTFENFDLSYYNEGNERKIMEEILNGCKRYAENFPNDDSAGLIFFGGTGLGKTHISAAIGNLVSSRGMDVIYESAQQIFDTCDAVRFNRLDVQERKKYETCQLLIIDDLGAECLTQYSVSAITSLIDLRIVNGRKTIISTNLVPETIRKSYGERLFSRLFGEFRAFRFVGKDIRMQKIKG